MLHLKVATGSCPVPERSPESASGSGRSEWFRATYLRYSATSTVAISGFWCVYVLRSRRDGKFYVGITSNLPRRLLQHQSRENPSTAKRLPVEVVYFEGHLSKADALRRERYFKTAKGKTTLRQITRDAFSEWGR